MTDQSIVALTFALGGLSAVTALTLLVRSRSFTRGPNRLSHALEQLLGLATRRSGESVLHDCDATSRSCAEQPFRTLVENARDVVAVVDADGTCRYVSPSVRRVLGYDPDDLVGDDAFSLLHPEDREAFRREVSRLDEGGSTRIDYRVDAGGGRHRSFEAIIVNLCHDPAVKGFVVNARDVTERRQYEQRLRVLNRVLRHDLRNEMNVVVGYADLLLETELTEEQAALVGTIREKGEAVVDLGEQTREVVETLGTNSRPSAVDVAEIVRQQATAAREPFPAATVTVDVPDGPVWARASRPLGDAVSRLVENAVEHSDRPEPTVELSVETTEAADEGIVTIRVADDGPGIPERERTAIADGTETPLEHLSGVDLWLVNWYVEGIDGELHLEDNTPRGAVVSLTLAAAEPPTTVEGSGRASAV